jgi:hypothetical protein
VSEPASVLQRWLGGGLTTVMLPTGIVFAYQIPDTEQIVEKGLIPDELRKAALSFAASAIDPATMSTEELARALRFMRTLVAQSLRYVWAGPVEPIDAWMSFDPGREHWQPVTLTAADFEEAAIDADDYAALQGIVSRQFTARQITVNTLGERGLIDRKQADQIIAADNARTVPGWASFRDERRRSDAGASGGTLARPPVVNRASKRAASRAGTRRSSS